jgi:ABC-type transport system involved in multi-copper enzyme maturation permease subunit
MKFREIFRFEFGFQARRFSTWLYSAVLLGFMFQMSTEVYVTAARDGRYLYNAPYVIASVTLLGSMLGLLTAAALAGDAAARDVQSRMHPLFYTTPVSRRAYLGGRFLAAFALNAVIQLAVPAAVLLAPLLTGLEAEFRGPFRPAGFLAAYAFIALPNAFVTTALLFSAAALTRRAMTAYLGGVLLFFTTMISWQFLAGQLQRWELAKRLDSLGIAVMSELGKSWTPAEKNTLIIGLQGSLLWNRVLWMSIAVGVLALTCARFRFAHPPVRAGFGARRRAQPIADAVAAVRRGPVAVPRFPRTFGRATHARQVTAVAGESFREMVTSWGGLGMAFLTIVLVLTGGEWAEHMGVPLVPTTGLITSFLGDFQEPIWMIIPLLIAYYAGELVWREREAGLGDIADAVPMPEWVAFAGKFMGLALVLASLQALMMAASMAVQAGQGHRDFQVGLYARILFGLQLTDYLLFALLAFVVHVLVDHKFVGHLVVLMSFVVMAFGPSLGLRHELLVYGSDPGWEYSDMRGFGPSLAAVLWYKVYWAAWAVLFAVVAKLLWIRGREGGVGGRLRTARGRFTRQSAVAVAVAMVLIVGLGGFVFYNTYRLDGYRSDDGEMERRAEYERRYARFALVPQPVIAGTHLHVEIHPTRRRAEIRGSYRLVNESGTAIDSIHVATDWEVSTGGVSFDRPATRVVDDEGLGHRIYVLAQPLQPGESLQMRFALKFAPRGFVEGGSDPGVAANGTFFVGHDWLPAIGYQPGRAIAYAADRRAHGLAPQRAVLSRERAVARGERRIAFDAVVGTDAGQVAVAPGTLRRAWTKGGRRYFHYAADAPIRNELAFFSAAYAVREARWHDVVIQVVHHPGHAWNVDRMVRGLSAALEYHTRHFGPYPYRQIRLVEHPGDGVSLHSFPINISYQEGFALLDPGDDPRAVDFPFAVVAHEVAHQWWGNQLSPAAVPGGALLSESLAWYSAFGVVEAEHGPEHLRRLMALMREAYLTPHSRAANPLLQADTWLLAYRKGPFAMYALREYVGEQPVNTALRRMLQKYGSGAAPLATSVDLYRELQAVTPDSLRPLLADLFETNTYWELATDSVSAQPAGNGAWRVTLDVQARKVDVGTTGAERERPMNDLVEIGVYAEGRDGRPGPPLYQRMHRVRSGRQRITVTVPGRPARAGIDPRSLLVEVKGSDNLRDVSQPGS